MPSETFDQPIESNDKKADSPVVQSAKEIAAEGCWYNKSKYSHGAKICWGGKIHECNNGSWVNLGTKC